MSPRGTTGACQDRVTRTYNAALPDEGPIGAAEVIVIDTIDGHPLERYERTVATEFGKWRETWARRTLSDDPIPYSFVKRELLDT